MSEGIPATSSVSEIWRLRDATESRPYAETVRKAFDLLPERGRAHGRGAERRHAAAAQEDNGAITSAGNAGARSDPDFDPHLIGYA
jgi:hypothetical protein